MIVTESSLIEVEQTDTTPLVVDIDGTLIRSDLLIESAFACLGSDPTSIIGLLGALLRGKAALKAFIAAKTAIDVAHLPYDQDILALIQRARRDGRKVYLASASNERYVAAIAAHFGFFDGWFASDGAHNLSSRAKAARLVAEFGAGGFDYIGNDKADLAVWQVARRRIAVRAAGSVRRQLLTTDPDAQILPAPERPLRDWIKLLRVHQWAKNALVFLPVITAQRFDLATLLIAISAFVAFSLSASSIYILNDLVDIEADRKHRSKKRRPLAAGTVPLLSAMIAAPMLLTTALVGAFLIRPIFCLTLAAYVAITTAYTFVLKRKMMIDVIALAGLYTIRVVGGATAADVPVSEWLLAFSMFIFTSLALIKRYVELAARIDADLPDPTNRNYRKSDLDIVAALAAAAGFNAVTVFALYVSSDAVHRLYRRPELLWLICPILMYWLGRALMVAHRRMMEDDPVLFALKDRNSLIAVALTGLILFSAI